jgi:predicted site-specific integrase-resolvase
MGEGVAYPRSQDGIAEKVVTFPNRLSRPGKEYLDMLFDSFGVPLTVLNSAEDTSANHQLTDEMMALLACCSGWLYACVLTSNRNS